MEVAPPSVLPPASWPAGVPARWRTVWLAPALLLLVVVVYGGRLDAPLTSDARFLTVRNGHVLDPAGIARVWTGDYFEGAMTPDAYRSGYYRPVTNALFWLEYRWAGERAAFYNTLQVLLHGANAFLVALLVGALWGDRRVGVLAAVLFAVHPVNAFAAAEPAARADVLFATFYLLALLAFDRALLRPKGRAPPVGELVLVVLLYLLSLLSKEMGITLPGALALLVALRHAQGRVPLRRLLWVVPAGLAGLAYLTWRFVVLDLGTSSMGYLEVHSRWSLMLAALKTVPIHLSRLLVPLGADYPELNPELVSFVDGSASDPLVYGTLLVTTALVVGGLSWRRHPQLAFCCAFFLVSLSPLLRVDEIGGTLDTNVVLAQERWIYLPALAILALVSRGLILLAERARAAFGRPGLAASLAVVGSLVLALGWSATQHAGRHTDPYALLRRLYLIPEERLDRMQRANRLMLYANLVALPMGDEEDAEARARAALELVPDSPLVAASVSRVLAAKGEWDEVRRVAAPWLTPTPAGMAEMSRSNFRVYDDLNRAGPEIAFLLARAEAHLGRPVLAARLLCEGVLRGGMDPSAESIWGEIWEAQPAPAPPLPAAPEDLSGCARWTRDLEA